MTNNLDKELQKEMEHWDSMPSETVQQYFAKARTMASAEHKVKGTVFQVYSYPDHTTLRFDGLLEVSIPHEVGSTEYDTYLGYVKISRSEVIVGIEARGFNALPEVRYLEGPKMKKIIPRR